MLDCSHIKTSRIIRFNLEAVINLKLFALDNEDFSPDN